MPQYSDECDDMQIGGEYHEHEEHELGEEEQEIAGLEQVEDELHHLGAIDLEEGFELVDDVIEDVEDDDDQREIEHHTADDPCESRDPPVDAEGCRELGHVHDDDDDDDESEYEEEDHDVEDDVGGYHLHREHYDNQYHGKEHRHNEQHGSEHYDNEHHHNGCYDNEHHEEEHHEEEHHEEEHHEEEHNGEEHSEEDGDEDDACFDHIDKHSFVESQLHLEHFEQGYNGNADGTFAGHSAHDLKKLDQQTHHLRHSEYGARLRHNRDESSHSHMESHHSSREVQEHHSAPVQVHIHLHPHTEGPQRAVGDHHQPKADDKRNAGKQDYEEFYWEEWYYEEFGAQGDPPKADPRDGDRPKTENKDDKPQSQASASKGAAEARKASSEHIATMDSSGAPSARSLDTAVSSTERAAAGLGVATNMSTPTRNRPSRSPVDILRGFGASVSKAAGAARGATKSVTDARGRATSGKTATSAGANVGAAVPAGVAAGQAEAGTPKSNGGVVKGLEVRLDPAPAVVDLRSRSPGASARKPSPSPSRLSVKETPSPMDGPVRKASPSVAPYPMD